MDFQKIISVTEWRNTIQREFVTSNLHSNAIRLTREPTITEEIQPALSSIFLVNY
jgi:hypothetical protein